MYQTISVGLKFTKIIQNDMVPVNIEFIILLER